MKLLVLAVLALAAAARADYHDDVFHFSTLRSPVSLAYHQQPAHFQHQYRAVSAAPALPAFFQPAAHSSHYFQPAATTFSRRYFEQPAYVAEYTAAPEYYTPDVVLQAPVEAKHTVFQQVQQPAAVFTSQVPVTTAYSSLGGLGSVSSLGSSLFARSGASYAPAYNGAQYRILKQVQEVDPAGPYRAHYATENGISASEEGSLTGAGPEGPAVAKRGSYSYTGPDGVQYTVNWVADEFGYRASGAHLPQAPEAPAAASAAFLYKKK